MIDPKSLRIGNYIQDETGEFFIVDEIRPDYINAGALGIYSAGFHDDFYIPLSPSLLERAGFTRGDNTTCNDSFYWIMVGGSELSINPENGVVWITKNGNLFNVPMLIEEYHLLQNLYYSLTGQELELKP